MAFEAITHAYSQMIICFFFIIKCFLKDILHDVYPSFHSITCAACYVAKMKQHKKQQQVGCWASLSRQTNQAAAGGRDAAVNYKSVFHSAHNVKLLWQQNL